MNLVRFMRRLSLDLLAIIFSLGCLPLMFLPSLLCDDQWYMITLILIIVILIAPSKFQNYITVITVFSISFLWSVAYSKQYLIKIEPYIDKTIVVKARVEGINTRVSTSPTDPYYVKIAINDDSQSFLYPKVTISVYWDQQIKPKAGQIWQLTLKTKVVHGYLNEGGFDSQRYAIANRSLLSAKLIQAELLEDNLSIRQLIADHSLPYIDRFTYRGILLALAFGDRSQMVDEHRIIMMQTGVAHLMAISGMHILLVFGLCCTLLKILMFFIPQRFIYFFIPIIIAWLAALFYAWLTGLNPPALRAMLALSIWIYLRFKNSQISAWQKLNRIVALLLLFDPLMILSESFWLSCYAVTSLIFLSDWLPLPKVINNKKRWYWIRLLHLQFGLILLMLPIQLIIFQGISLVSLLTNLIAIPVITLLTLPLIIFALFFSISHCIHLASWCWFIANKSLEWLFVCLDKLNLVWLDISSDFYLLSIFGWLAFVIVRTELWRRFGFTLLIILMILCTPFFKQHEDYWRLDMLDVGHGLAIVIHNGKSAILFDTGAKWERNSAAERIILPFLRWHNLNLEGIIISHQHNDHIGGLDLLQSRYPNAWLMSSSLALDNHYQCVAGNTILWNSLSVNVLWPTQLVKYAQNADSCVVQVTDGHFSVLLTGDLERNQEYQLVTKYRNQLASTILQIPHHGSSTSSSYAFLNHVKPVKALISTSRYNPWKLPSHKVIARYQDLHIDYYITAKTGQISLIFDNQKWRLKTMRSEIKPRWYHDWFGSLPIYE
ncbi:DNA internalization-related competence protein ComEC/Rec2 [Gilliamella apicola]|uniref:DNA internalization-related competence protein ComEC/Rec2 n=2 Tax=Gilliamella apicola TaxID=1196095 RepID=UPI000A33BCC2|nr:DNA internalization-related competence protein ComEC/Rec2 [Gilliamella apicola]OTQ07080.1 DNA internalization-related competence protein ComEC/Rec2 [Gilliamella apicola]OTQ22122.1 DNA internalization-related competence protein ComEC/Rec2 [Gilliamella apicola]